MGIETVVLFSNPVFRNELSDLVREGAQGIIRQPMEESLLGIMEGYATDRDEHGCRALGRNGYAGAAGVDSRWCGDHEDAEDTGSKSVA